MKKTLLIKSLLLLCALMVGNVAWATDVTYTISSKNTLTTTGTAPNGSSATISETYSTSKQMTSGNSQTLTLKSYNGYKITQIKLSMRSNSSGGAGKLSYYINGGTNYSYLVGSSNAGVAFNQAAWHGSWSTSYVNVTKSNLNISCGTSDVIIKVEATANSLYCQSYTITYEADDSRTATTVNIDAAGITNTNKLVSTEAGTLAATVKAGNTPIDGASVTWSSSTETVATIDASGAVTLVGAGTTTITASYAGNETYKPSSSTYNLTVINENPNYVTIWSEDFSNYNNNSETYSYIFADGTGSSSGSTSVKTESIAGGESPELMVGKKGSGTGDTGGSFTATIPLQTSTYCYSGDLTLKYKTNAYPLNVKTTTTGLTVDGETSSGTGIDFSTSGEHTITFNGITTSTASITIVFTATDTKNVRLDDIVLKGEKVALTKVATPAITPASGAVVSGAEVTITCDTENASIYYTTDGTVPTSTSTAYNPANKPTITAATTIKAIAVKDGLTDSEVASASYTIAAPCTTPTFSVEAGDVEKGTTVTISTTTEGATIYYTTNGTTPTTGSTAYSSPIAINSDMTIKAIAVKDGMANSEVAEVTYTIIDYATLPFNWAGGTSSALAALTGVTTNGLGDYADSNAPYRVKMDSANDYIQIKTNTQPVNVLIGVKMIGGATTSKIKVQESADGLNFTDVKELTISGKQNDVLNLKVSNLFAATTRYVKIIKSVHGSNIGVGPISVLSENELNRVPVTITTADYATFVSNEKTDFEGTGITAYTAKVNGNYVTLTAIEEVPANTPVVVHKDVEETTIFNVPVTTADIAAVSENDLCVSTGTNAVGANVYVLGNTNGIGFYKWKSDNSLSAGKVYLNVPAMNSPTESRDYLTFAFEDQATGVGASLMNSEKCKVNSDIFDLQGRRVVNPTKGLYIVNGKKVIVK